ncbi:hypothetical protein [Fischerella sp. PCC 9605]|uniref:hypothetical protein n=1 Tax=Fischerella sp. PCC 9605 TaxID=1173024 RepID=UPI0012DF18B7|nr:hypothetical protein [Fischerella sp. PCC 9605]
MKRSFFGMELQANVGIYILSLVRVQTYTKAIATLPTTQAEVKLIALWLDGNRTPILNPSRRRRS